jgi:hypothetical protein
MKLGIDQMRAIAARATKGEWYLREAPPSFGEKDPDKAIVEVRIPGKPYAQTILADDYFEELSRRADVEFVAAFNPEAMLELLDIVEGKK